MNWRGLLVSVRNAAEAAEALDGGAAIIDVKEPRHGSLGAAEPEAIAAVARVVGRRRPWTMACGELGEALEGEPNAVARSIGRRLDRMLALLEGSAVPPAAVKVGLAGAAGTDWQRRLLTVFQLLPAGSDPRRSAGATARSRCGSTAPIAARQICSASPRRLEGAAIIPPAAAENSSDRTWKDRSLRGLPPRGA